MKYLRLKKQADFQKLFRKGKRAHSPSVTLLYAKSEKMTMGISIGKRHGKSVQRNRIKRLLREAFRATQDEMQNSYAIVLIPKVAEDYAFETFKKHLQWLIKKEKLWIFGLRFCVRKTRNSCILFWEKRFSSRMLKCFVCVWYFFINGICPRIPANTSPLARNIRWKASTTAAWFWEYCSARGVYFGATRYLRAGTTRQANRLGKNGGFYKPKE